MIKKIFKSKYSLLLIAFISISVLSALPLSPFSSTAQAAETTSGIPSSTPTPAANTSKAPQVIVGKPAPKALQKVQSFSSPAALSQSAQETLTVPSDGSHVQSQPLAVGTPYTIRISGTFVWGGCDPVNCPNGGPDYVRQGDAAFLTDDHFASFADPFWSSFVYLEMNGSRFTASSFNPQHEYTFQMTGDGNPATFAIHDCSYCYPDNSGSLTVEIMKDGETKPPLILIPGIMGSKLAVTGSQPINPIQKKVALNPFDPASPCVNGPLTHTYNQGDLIWIDESTINKPFTGLKISVPCSNFLDVLQFDSNGQPLYPQIGLNNQIADESYKSTKEYLTNKNAGYPGYTEGQDFFIFPYDWRKDINLSEVELEASISGILTKTNSTQVDILAHSMGGLVARKYISNQSRAQNVHKLVELGTPHAGLPKVLAQLMYNTCPFKKWQLVAVCVPNGQEARKLVQNFPGTFELLPSQFYYQLYPNSNNYPLSDDRNIDNDQSTNGPLTYAKTRTLLANLGKNMTMFDNAQTFHNSIDWTNTSTINGVNTYLIAGSGQGTIGQIHDYTSTNIINFLVSPFLKITQDVDATNGDDSVPVRSAIASQQETSQPNVFYANQTHNYLMQDDALKMAVRLIQGNGTYSDLAIQKTPYVFNGKIIGMYSPAVLNVYDDQNNHTGPTADGTIEANIPGSSYDELGEAKFIYLPQGGHYRLTTKATGNGSFDLKVKDYSGSQLSQVQTWLGVAQTASTTATMNLDTATPILKVDIDNNGTVDSNLQATSTITGASVSDFTPPVTTASLSGTQGVEGWYRSNATATLSAQDAGAGVLNTYYYTDGETTAHPYTAPVTISTEGTTKVWYFSVDKAGNAEAPKSVTIQIDKTAPELVVQFDTVTKQLLGSGTDDRSGIASVNQTSTAITVTDKAGNTAQFTLTSQRTTFGATGAQTVQLTGLKYNGQAATIPQTTISYSWTNDAAGTITILAQKYALTNQETVDGGYTKIINTTAIKRTVNGQTTSTVYSGLKIIQLKSEKQKLKVVF